MSALPPPRIFGNGSDQDVSVGRNDRDLEGAPAR